MADDSIRKPADADELRLIAPVFALAIAVLAAVTDTSSAGNVVLAAIPVVAFGLWSYRPTAVPLAVLTLAVVVPVVVAQRSGALEPLFFRRIGSRAVQSACGWRVRSRLVRS